ncbi:MAG: ATP phosphoribosyltransferase [Euryarchaeota archaeon RBG_19FT_COMBO_56_21]|nr:MAG: ATP phosphoribosyltransferase [Euryarchaeota archaeon RBG_19FT_COMBO_56_21]
MSSVRIAIPNKGRLNQSAIRLMNKIGFPVPEASNRTLLAEFSKGRYQVLLARAQDIPEFVEMGAADLGITGLDLISESGRKVESIMPLDFGKCRLVVAVPEDSGIKRAEDIEDGCTVATTFPNLTTAYFTKLGKKVELAEVSGATEVAPQVGLADVITDLTETGSTLKLNHLREVGVILESRAVLIGNAKLMAEKKDKVEEVTSAIASVINASRKRYLMANVPKDSLPNLRTLLPGVSGPTVMNIMGREDFVAIHAVTNEDELNGVITMLKSIGATGILVIPIERMVL